MDTTSSLTFRRSRAVEILCLIFLVPIGVFCVLGSPWAIVEMIRRGDHPVAIVAMTVLGFVPLMAFGAAMLMLTLSIDRHVTVSRHEIRVHRWIGGRRTFDIGSLVQLVQYDQPGRLVFLPTAGPPLLTLDTGDFPSAMPAAIGEHLGMRIDRFAELDKSELRAKYPKNAKETVQRYELDNEWRGRKWEW